MKNGLLMLALPILFMSCQAIELPVEFGELPSETQNTLSPYWAGYYDAENYIENFEAWEGWPYGGDGSILCVIVRFDIPLKWYKGEGIEIGAAVTDEEMRSETAATLTLCAEPDYNRCDAYQRGAAHALCGMGVEKNEG